MIIATPLVTEFAESGAVKVIISIAGTSRAPSSRATRMCGWKRGDLDEIAARQRAADEGRQKVADLQQQVGLVSQSAVVQQWSLRETWDAVHLGRFGIAPSWRP